MILTLEKGETALEALARLGKDKTKGPKKVPKWKQKRQERKQGIDSMDVDDSKKEEEDPKQKKIREAIDAITEAADKLLGRDYPDIYDKEREWLVREYRAETGETWVEPAAPEKEEKEEEQSSSLNGHPKMWEFRWTDGRDGGGSQGPYDGPTMKAWQDAGRDNSSGETCISVLHVDPRPGIRSEARENGPCPLTSDQHLMVGDTSG